jgi:phosphoglucomutase
VRDKDAIASCAMIAELVAYAKDRGQSLFDMLMEIYGRFGFYLEDLISITKKGKSGAEEIQEMMRGYRENPPKTIAGSAVVEMLDYKTSERLDLRTGKRSPIQMEKSNVLQFITEDGSKISARPSGTEPKIKFYFSVNRPLAGKAAYIETLKLLKNQIQAITKDLGLS